MPGSATPVRVHAPVGRVAGSEHQNVVRRSQGKPIESALRTRMEEGFGERFDDVLVHDDASAHADARALNAHAFTIGRDVFLDRSSFMPSSRAGRLLLAHELAHVVQQRADAGPIPGPAPGAFADRDARRAAGAVLAGQANVAVDVRTSIGVAREARTEDVQTLSDADLAAEHANTEAWLIAHAQGDEEYERNAAYIAQLEAEVSRRMPSRLRGEQRRRATVGAVEKMMLAGGWLGPLGVLGPVEVAFLGEFATGLVEAIDEQPAARKQRLVDRFFNLYFSGGHFQDKLDYNLGVLKGIGLGIWGEIKGIVELILLLPKLQMKINDWIWAQGQKLGNFDAISARARELSAAIAEATATAVSELQEFFADPAAAMKKMLGMAESLLGSALEQAYQLGHTAVDSAFRFLEKPFGELGEELGKVIGWAIFQIVMLVGTQAIGNLIAKGAGLAARFAKAVLEEAVQFFRGVGELFAEAGELLETVGRAIKGAFAKAWEAVLRVFQRARTFIEELIGVAAKEEEVAATVAKPFTPTSATNVEGLFGEAETELQSVPIGGEHPPTVTNVGGATPQTNPFLPAPGEGGPMLSAGQESTGAGLRGAQYQSASAQTERSMMTAIRADVAEGQAYGDAVFGRGEIGLERPSGTNIGGRADFLTAGRENGQMYVYVNDVKASGVGRFPTPDTGTVKATWMNQVQDAVGPGRLNLGNSAVEKEIQDAVAGGFVKLRQIDVNYTSAAQGTITYR
jgi:hypothetical protein